MAVTQAAPAETAHSRHLPPQAVRSIICGSHSMPWLPGRAPASAHSSVAEAGAWMSTRRPFTCHASASTHQRIIRTAAAYTLCRNAGQPLAGPAAACPPRAGLAPLPRNCREAHRGHAWARCSSRRGRLSPNVSHIFVGTSTTSVHATCASLELRCSKRCSSLGLRCSRRRWGG
jgi:hypothetical protein